MSSRCEANNELMEGDATHNDPSTHPNGKTEETISPCTIELQERQCGATLLSSEYVENQEKEVYGGGDDTGQSGPLASAASSNNLRECLACILRSNACSINSVKRSLCKLKKSFPGLKIPERNSDLSNLLKQIAVFKAPGVYVLKDQQQPRMEPPFSTMPERDYSACLGTLEGKRLCDMLRRAKRMTCSRERILSEEDLNAACLEYAEKYPIFFRVHQLYRDTRGGSLGCKVVIDTKDMKVLEQLYSLLREDLLKLKSQIEDFQSTPANST